MGSVVLRDQNLSLIFIWYPVYSDRKMVALHTPVCPNARQETLCKHRYADSTAQGKRHLYAPHNYALHRTTSLASLSSLNPTKLRMPQVTIRRPFGEL